MAGFFLTPLTQKPGNINQRAGRLFLFSRSSGHADIPAVVQSVTLIKLTNPKLGRTLQKQDLPQSWRGDWAIQAPEFHSALSGISLSLFSSYASCVCTHKCFLTLKGVFPHHVTLSAACAILLRVIALCCALRPALRVFLLNPNKIVFKFGGGEKGGRKTGGGRGGGEKKKVEGEEKKEEKEEDDDLRHRASRRENNHLEQRGSSRTRQHWNCSLNI